MGATSTEIAGVTCAPPSWNARWSLEGATPSWSHMGIADFDRGQWERIG